MWCFGGDTCVYVHKVDGRNTEIYSKKSLYKFFQCLDFIYLTTTSDDQKTFFLSRVFSKELSTSYNEKIFETLVVLCLR